MKLVAIDFETADYAADSACAVGIVSIENGKLAKKGFRLIRPPRSKFPLSRIHGISWHDVKRESDFTEVWDSFRDILRDVDYFVAHNAAYDRRVLSACLERAGKKKLSTPFVCTIKVARTQWNIRPTTLSNVCRRLGISLKHHDAQSDALASASIVIRALNEGFSIRSAIVARSAVK